MVQGEGSGVRAGEMLLAHPHVAQSPQRRSAGNPVWERLAQIFLSPSPLGPGTGGGWKGELQPRARRDVCPQGRDPRDCCNPDPFFPGDTGLCSWPDWL